MIDWNRVTELREEIGEDDFAEVAALFLSEIAAAIDQLCADPKSPVMGDILHFIKSSALNLGFSELCQLCETGEKTAPGKIALAPLAEVFARSKTAFLKGQITNSATVSSRVISE